MTDTPVPGEPVPLIQGEVVAVGTAVNSLLPGLGALLEQAAVKAIEWCLSQGITDPEMILAAKHKAFRDTTLAFEANASQTTPVL